MEGFRVAELAERAGIAPSTVRFYERAGLLSPAQRAHNGNRMTQPQHTHPPTPRRTTRQAPRFPGGEVR
jgi:predicted site-specific integrase-resolvase